MAKLRLSINSTDVLGVYGIVDIVFNDTTLVSAKQLSATVESLEYNIAGIDNTSNTLKISLLNDQAHDENNDGDYGDASDKLLVAIVSALSYSIDDINYISLLPQTQVTHTIPSGDQAGAIIDLRSNISQFTSFGTEWELKFNNDGLENNEYFTGYNVKIVDSDYYDSTGNVIYSLPGSEA
jgi:hypothetical protein